MAPLAPLATPMRVIVTTAFKRIVSPPFYQTLCLISLIKWSKIFSFVVSTLNRKNIFNFYCVLLENRVMTLQLQTLHRFHASCYIFKMLIS